MATMVLATAGRALGGPWGAALGALAGRAIERAGAGRRADDLQVHSSAYGVAIPKVFGTMRVAGNLVWSTPVGPSEIGKGGAGRGAVASFALVLAQAPVARIGRIWADGTLLRDDNGLMARRTGMREHLAGSTAPDPLLAAAHAGRMPSFAGLAYVVFENLDLGPFGGRLPNLAFEVIGTEDGPADWARRVLGHAPDGASPLGQGLLAGGRLRDDVEAVGSLSGAKVVDTPEGLGWAPNGAPVIIPADQMLGGDAAGNWSWNAMRPGVELAYLDVARDFHRGVQRAGADGRARAVEIAAAMSAGDAARLAARLAAEAPPRATLSLALPWAWLRVRAGDVVCLGEDPRAWRVVRRTIVGMRVELDCELVDREPLAVGDPGLGGEAPLRPVPPTRVVLFELPGRGLVLAVGGDAGWEGARVLVKVEPQEAVVDLGLITQRSIIGSLSLSAPPLDDDILMVDVADAEALAVGHQPGMFGLPSNQLCIDGEVIGAESFRAVASGRLEISGLHRGLGDTGPMIAAHAAGRLAVFLGSPTTPLDAQPGALVEVVAIGPGDQEEGVVASFTVQGRASLRLAALGGRHVSAPT